jgi:hypothetical protein
MTATEFKLWLAGWKMAIIASNTESAMGCLQDCELSAAQLEVLLTAIGTFLDEQIARDSDKNAWTTKGHSQ